MWEEHKLKTELAAAKAESENNSSEVPDTDIEGKNQASLADALLTRHAIFPPQIA